ncbi:MAG: DNA-binding protein [Firmicutes bacterium HGW-Firmicutes-21]|nr:MAG: DNA-binding protein [Firmicutes bacterium HGW-Firmicutes-21]
MNEKRAVICRMLDFYAGVLSLRQREALELYYYEDLSLAEVAENLGITRQGVYDAVKHGEEALYALESTLGMVKRNSSVSEAARRIIELTDNEKIKALAGEILAGQI